MDETLGFQCLGHSNWTICSLFSGFQLFRIQTGESNSRGEEGRTRPRVGHLKAVSQKTRAVRTYVTKAKHKTRLKSEILRFDLCRGTFENIGYTLRFSRK